MEEDLSLKLKLTPCPKHSYYGLKYVPLPPAPNHMLKFQLPEPQKVTPFVDKVSKNVIELKGSLRVWPYSNILASQQESSHCKPGRGASGELRCAHTLILDFQTPEM